MTEKTWIFSLVFKATIVHEFEQLIVFEYTKLFK